jgi:hypothetical protein
VRVEDSDIEFIKKLDCMRVSTRPGLTKWMQDIAYKEGLDVGREYKLPMSFSHSPGQMQRHYMNSIQMVRVSSHINQSTKFLNRALTIIIMLFDTTQTH